MTIKQGTSYLDRPPHETTEATRRFEEELDRETEEAATDELCGYGLPNGGAIVKSLNGSMVIVGRLDGGENYAKSGLLWSASDCRHFKPDPVKGLLEEFALDIRMEHFEKAELTEQTIEQYAARIREAVSA